MSHIANAVDSLLKETGLSAAELARLSGLHEATVSRIKAGRQIWVSSEDLEKIAASFLEKINERKTQKTKPNPKSQHSLAADQKAKIHARLLYAHLQDECTGSGSRFIDMVLLNDSGPMILMEAKRSKPVLPPKLQHNLDVIAEHITTNRHVRDLVESVASLCQHGSLPQAHTE